MAKFKSTGTIASTDYHSVKFVGYTKGGGTVTIEMAKAINLGNIDWAFKEKDDTVESIVFTGVYTNTDEMVSGTADAPYTIEVDAGVTAGAAEIMLGAGKVYVDNVLVALTRGGSQFTATREFRRINADGDRGAVEGRIVMDAEEPTLTLNALTMLTKFSTFHPGIAAVV